MFSYSVYRHVYALSPYHISYFYGYNESLLITSTGK